MQRQKRIREKRRTRRYQREKAKVMQSVNICTDEIESNERQSLCCSAVALRPHGSCWSWLEELSRNQFLSDFSQMCHSKRSLWHLSSTSRLLLGAQMSKSAVYQERSGFWNSNARRFSCWWGLHFHFCLILAHAEFQSNPRKWRLQRWTLQCIAIVMTC